MLPHLEFTEWQCVLVMAVSQFPCHMPGQMQYAH